jgi:hypothetical protein
MCGNQALKGLPTRNARTWTRIIGRRLCSIQAPGRANAFTGCKSLTRSWIVASVDEISGNFAVGSAVREICVGGENPHFEPIDGFVVIHNL